MEKEDEQLVDNIRKNLLTERPCGTVVFIQTVENIVGRALMAKKRGWAKKDK